MRIDTNNVSSGSSAFNQFKIPVYNGGTAKTRMHVDWGDGTHSYFNTQAEATAYTKTYQNAGSYLVKIYGRMPYFRFNNTGDRLKLVAVEQWGRNPWRTMNGLLYGCANMTITATDVPNMLWVTDMSNAFRGCTLNNYSINGWNTSRVENMTSTWQDNVNFNASLNEIDVRKVKFFSSTFRGCTIYNQPMNLWQTQSAQTMNLMFHTCSAFNQNVGNFSMGLVTTTDQMFYFALNFNNGGSTDIQNWNMASNQYYSLMFLKSSFDQPVNNWNVSSALTFNGTFSLCPFNHPITTWTTPLLQNTDGMFQGNSAFNQDVSNLSMGLVTTIARMFQDATSFNNGGSPNINNWNLISCLNMDNTFFNAYAFNQPVGNWNTSNVTSMFRTFQSALIFNQFIGNWPVQNVQTMLQMFFGALAMNQNFGNWTPSALTTASAMFLNSGLSRANYDLLLTGWTGWNGITATKTLQNNVSFGAGTTQYTLLSNAAAARSYLTGTKGWTITDGGGTM